MNEADPFVNAVTSMFCRMREMHICAVNPKISVWTNHIPFDSANVEASNRTHRATIIAQAFTSRKELNSPDTISLERNRIGTNVNVSPSSKSGNV